MIEEIIYLVLERIYMDGFIFLKKEKKLFTQVNFIL